MNVNVDGIGKLTFPDNTDKSVIQDTVKRLVSEKQKSEPTFMEKYLPSIKRTGEIYMQEVKSGEEAMNKALEKPTGRSIVGGLVGALQWGFSPLTAAVKGIVREPIQQGLEDVGVPKGAANFAGEMIETGAYFIPYGKAVQTAILGKEALETAKTVQRVAGTLPKGKTTAKALEFPEGLSKEAIADAIKPISEANQKILKTSVVDDVIQNLKPVVGESWNPTQKRITQEIVDYMVSKPSEIEHIAKVYKLEPAQLAAQIKETMTLAGRDLGRMGNLAKSIKKSFNTPYMNQLSEVIARDLPEVTTLDKFGTAFKTVENVRRAALVSQFATTMRNIISQGARLGIGSIDDGFRGAANAYLKSGGETTFNSVKSTLRGMGEGLDAWTATINRFKPAERAKLIEILGAQNAIAAKAKMFTTPVQDVVLTGKISKTLNYFNTTQEYFFRNIAFEAKLRNFARQGGIDFNSLKAVDIPEKMLAESAEHALRMTYAAMPKSNFGKEWVRAMTNPVITALVNPFPRFLWGNALPFLYRFSPIGFLEAARPSVIADIVGGNPAKFTKAISQATIGTTMLNMGFYVRNSKYAGERWYEIKVGDKRIDTRAFAPFSTYLFLAEAIQNPEKIKAADFGSALLSLNRIGGTGLVLADIMQSKDAATTISYLKRVGGAWLSGFTVPVKTFKDLYTAVDPKEAIIRDTKGNELFGPIQQNIPILSQKSPRAVTPLQTGDIRTETPLLRQFTGLSYRTKNALQKEVDTIQLPYNKIYPRTGDAKSDRMVSAVMANILEKAYPLLESKTNYLKMDEPTRRILLGQLFSDTKAQARLIIMKQYPEIGAKIKIDSIPGDIKSILQSRGILPQ